MRHVIIICEILAIALLAIGCASTPAQITYTVKVVDIASKQPIAGATVTVVFPSTKATTHTDGQGVARFGFGAKPKEGDIAVTMPSYDAAVIHLAHPLPHQVEIGMSQTTK